MDITDRKSSVGLVYITDAICDDVHRFPTESNEVGVHYIAENVLDLYHTRLHFFIHQ